MPNDDASENLPQNQPSDGAQDLPIEYRRCDPNDGFAVTWQMTVEHYAKLGRDITKEPMRKDIVRIIRGAKGHENSM